MQRTEKTNKKPNNPINRQTNEMNRKFLTDLVQMANKHMKKYSTSIRKMQITTTLKFPIIPVRRKRLLQPSILLTYIIAQQLLD